jgi:predicted nucleotidyltransferase
MTSSLLLGPDCRAAILVRTFVDPEREFYLRELVRLSGFALRSVQEEVDRLVAADLLAERRHGNRRYLSANKRHPLFRPVREIVLKTDGLVNVLQDALGVDQVDFALVFGSIASGMPSAQSDVDVLVVGDVSLRQVVRRFSVVPDVLGREVNPVVWTPEEFEQRQASGDHFLATVLNEPTIMIADEAGSMSA